MSVHRKKSCLTLYMLFSRQQSALNIWEDNGVRDAVKCGYFFNIRSALLHPFD